MEHLEYDQNSEMLLMLYLLCSDVHVFAYMV